ncbi:uncharacterized protein LOC115239482 [Formica exsecta]|uniref:uncharacterized protein LOC115239482 n=1 Tax=Formica exsecta TaxID=72781 RepID=UPI0011446958|nr:uncharacterized protein LOC115239482 [Formica exsecta]
MLKLYSALHRLLLVTAWCCRWLRRPLERLAPEVRANPVVQRVLRASEVEEARLSWIRVIQAENFKKELAAIEKGKSLPTRSQLTRLTPFRDPQGILRVGGRIKRALLSYNARHPIILPGESNITRLIIEAYHRRTLHGGMQLTLSSIRQDTRAVHLDVASVYSADAFLAALRRLIARRGLCRALYSDCGTNFVGADAQLRALFAASSQKGQRIAKGLAAERIEWHFNPPAAPNFGGLWKAAVKAAKHHLPRVIGDAKLTYEEMATLLAQIESCLNSHPLQALSDDPEDLEALTPGHFLVGTALNAVPEPFLALETTTRLSRWQHLQQLRDHFWSRWSREYLHSLTHRP